MNDQEQKNKDQANYRFWHFFAPAAAFLAYIASSAVISGVVLKLLTAPPAATARDNVAGVT